MTEEAWQPQPVIIDVFAMEFTGNQLVGSLDVIDGRWGASLCINPVTPGRAPPNAAHHGDALEDCFTREHPLLVYDLWNDPLVRLLGDRTRGIFSSAATPHAEEDSMTHVGFFQAGAVVLIGMIAVGQPVAGGDEDPGGRYAVTVTNVTRGQTFTPILVATHKAGLRLFELGQPASAELATLAEEGNTAPLAAVLSAMPQVKDIASSGALLPPGESVTIMVGTRGAFDRVSLAAMLIPTNDGFLALNGVQGPRGRSMMTLFSPTYDAGSERNDELCASVPGPFFAECGGPGGGGMPGGGEGYVHIHAGIHGIGNLVAADRDWRNPVAQITLRRAH